MKTKIFSITFLLLVFLCALSYAALDLKFTSVIGISPAAPKTGDSVTLSVAFKAEGDTATNVKIVASIDGTQMNERTFASVPAEAVRTDSFIWTATSGNHNVTYTLDPNHSTGDSDYTNNTISTTLDITSSGSREMLKADPKVLKPKNIRDNLKIDPKVLDPKPDLEVKNLAINPIVSEGGGDDAISIVGHCYRTWDLRVRVKNIGNKDTTEGFLITVMFDGADEYVYEVFGPILLAAGHEYEFYKAGYVSYKQSIRVVASVDSSHKIEESNETNNLLQITEYCE